MKRSNRWEATEKARTRHLTSHGQRRGETVKWCIVKWYSASRRASHVLFPPACFLRTLKQELGIMPQNLFFGQSISEPPLFTGTVTQVPSCLLPLASYPNKRSFMMAARSKVGHRPTMSLQQLANSHSLELWYKMLTSFSQTQSVPLAQKPWNLPETSF